MRNDLPAGTLVICSYRMPSWNQPWIPGNFQIGIVEEPGDSPEAWNGKNSERYYCEACHMTRLRYPWGIMHDQDDSLTAIPAEHAALPYPDQLRLWLGEDGEKAKALYERSRKFNRS